MPLDIWSLVLAALSFLLIVATIYWGITDDPSPTPPAPSDALLVAGGHHLTRVPLHNRHRTHGRHRAE